MASKSMTRSLATAGPVLKARSPHDVLVAGFKAKLAKRASPLDNIAPQQLDEARKEFQELPEVAGEPLPAGGVLS
jgi:hypothetical protein